MNKGQGVQKEGLQKLYEQAKAIDPQAMLTISPNDKKRIILIIRFLDILMH